VHSRMATNCDASAAAAAAAAAAAVCAAWATRRHGRAAAPAVPRAKAQRQPPRVVLFGPPGSGKTTIIPFLLESPDGVVVHHIRPGALFHAERAAGTPFGKQLDTFYAHAAAVGVRKAVPPPELFLPFLRGVFDGIVRRGEGWVLEKGPRLVDHFQAWRAAGIWPDKIVVLDASPDVIVARTRARLQDPMTGASYNRALPDTMPTDPAVLARLVQRGDDVDEVSQSAFDWPDDSASATAVAVVAGRGEQGETKADNGIAEVR
jgi:adenylate kinase family enzyme